MKKLVYLLFVSMVLLACRGEEKKVQSQIFIEKELSDFIASNPNWGKDEATQAETTDRFQRKLIKLSNEPGFLNGMPLKFSSVTDTTESGQAVKIANFIAYNDNNRPIGSVLNYALLHIKGIVSDEQLKKLKLNDNYTLQGNLQRQGKRADVKFIKVSDFKGYDLGKYTFVITKFDPIEKK